MRNKVRGFTLIEVMVAVAVIGLAVTALFSLLSTSLFNLRRVEDLHRITLANEDIMNRVLMLPSLPPSGEAQGNLDEPKARWLVRLTPWIPETLEGKPSAAVMKIDVEMQWQGRAGPRVMKLESVKPAKISYEHYDLYDAINKIIPD